MKSQNLTVIVPRLSPSVDGVGDYGLILAKKMRQDYGIQTEFIVADAKWVGESQIEGFNVKKLSTPTSADLLNLLQQNKESNQSILLHYVGYGYARRGCPVWLVKALCNWRSATEDGKLIVMFHELFAFGPIWSTQFWTSPLQRFLAAKLAINSDHCSTSKIIYAEILKRYSRGKHSSINVLPVFSNIGEPENVRLLKNRKKRLVIFGSRGPRKRVYEKSRDELERVCKEFGITEILDIGPNLGIKLEPVNSIPINILGIKSSAEVSSLLSETMIGFINYQTEYLAKSGIFASYCSHGVLPMAVWYDGQQTDSVHVNTHYWLAGIDNSLPRSITAAQNVADNAFQWYQEHRLSIHAENFAKFI